MVEEWNEKTVQQLIDDHTEESQGLEYKRADSLSKQNNKKTEITKDVSAMANSDGGKLIYGVKEYDEEPNRHLPEKIDPVDRMQFSREWLEQVISSIRPRIEGFIIHPVDVTGVKNGVVYVVEILQGTTAHQAKDFKYYMRYNFTVNPMYDYQVRDVMNRGTTPRVVVDFALEFFEDDLDIGAVNRVHLTALLKNEGPRTVRDVKLMFTFPDFAEAMDGRIEAGHRSSSDHLSVGSCGEPPQDLLHVVYRNNEVLFRTEEVDIGRKLGYNIVAHQEQFLAWISLLRDGSRSLDWRLYADDMPPKQGSIPWSDMCASAPSFKWQGVLD